MKNVTQRTKIVLVVAAVLVVVVIAGVAYFQTSGEALFGTVISISIKPSSSTILIGQSETLSSDAASSPCSWTSSNPSVVSITSSSAKSAAVLAKGIGTATITEKCGALASGSASVTVNPAPTPTPTRTPTPVPAFFIAPENGQTTMQVGVEAIWDAVNPPGLPCEWESGMWSGSVFFGRFPAKERSYDGVNRTRVGITPLEVTGSTGGILYATCGGVTHRRDVRVIP